MKNVKFASALVAALMLANVAGYATAADTGAKVGQYGDDTVITTKVKTAIMKDKALKSTEINVETANGVVQLSGFVAQPADIAHAEKVAAGVKGVKSVKNDIKAK
jgi:osmotically-inducible protein OsmY